MHVLIIPSWYPRIKGDNFGSFFREQAIALNNQGVKVGVIYPNIQSINKIRFAGFSFYKEFSYNDCGVNVLQCNTFNWTPKIQKTSSYLWAAWGMRLFKQYISKYGMPDIVQAQSMLNACILAKQLKSKYNIPYIVTEHSSAFIRGRFSPSELKWALSFTNEASHRFAVSQAQVDFLSSKSAELKWSYLPNIVNRAFLESEPSNTVNYNFIHVANLDKNKGTALVLEAFANEFKGDSNVFLTVCGDGPERELLEVLVQQFNLSDQVTFTGVLSRDEVLEQMKRASSLIVSSYFETFSIVCIEALAIGIPVVATRCGGPESIINSLNGLLVDKGCSSSLSEGMRKIYSEKHRFKSELIKKDCATRFSEDAVVNKLKEVMLNIVSEKIR